MIRIRQATPQDSENVSRIVCLCYEGFGRTDGYPNDVIDALKQSRGSVQCICELIADEQVFVAEDRDCIQGMISIRDNEITKLYIDPQFQRKSVGKALFLHAEAFVRECGFEYLYLGAAGRSMLPFYEKMGMRIDRQRVIDCGPCRGMVGTVFEKNLEKN